MNIPGNKLGAVCNNIETGIHCKKIHDRRFSFSLKHVTSFELLGIQSTYSSSTVLVLVVFVVVVSSYTSLTTSAMETADKDPSNHNHNFPPKLRCAPTDATTATTAPGPRRPAPNGVLCPTTRCLALEQTSTPWTKATGWRRITRTPTAAAAAAFEPRLRDTPSQLVRRLRARGNAFPAEKTL